MISCQEVWFMYLTPDKREIFETEGDGVTETVGFEQDFEEAVEFE